MSYHSGRKYRGGVGQLFACFVYHLIAQCIHLSGRAIFLRPSYPSFFHLIGRSFLWYAGTCFPLCPPPSSRRVVRRYRRRQWEATTVRSLARSIPHSISPSSFMCPLDCQLFFFTRFVVPLNSLAQSLIRLFGQFQLLTRFFLSTNCSLNFLVRFFVVCCLPFPPLFDYMQACVAPLPPATVGSHDGATLPVRRA